jgi:hypothetical protein
MVIGSWLNKRHSKTEPRFDYTFAHTRETMPTPRETILQALLGALQTVPAATILRGAILPERIPEGGLLILRDGDPGTPEVTLSPLQYHYEHRAEIEVIVQGKTPAARDAAFDEMLSELATSIKAGRTLGGLCDWVEAQAQQPVDLPVEGAEALKAAIVPIILTYTTADPLG